MNVSEVSQEVSAVMPQRAPAVAPSNKPPCVAVVGAGIAGLTAAYRLMREGMIVTVFEAATVVGGRMGDRREGDIAFNSGARLVYPFGVDFHRLVADLGLTEIMLPLRGLSATCVAPGGQHLIELMPSYRSLLTPGLGLGERLGLIRHALQMRAAKNKVSPDWANSAMALNPAYDDMTLADYIRDALGPNVLKQMVEPVFRATRSFNPETISALFYLSTVPHLVGEEAVYTLRGGMGTVCHELAQQLNVRTDMSVKSIEQNARVSSGAFVSNAVASVGSSLDSHIGSSHSSGARSSASMTVRFANGGAEDFDYVICAVEGSLARDLVSAPQPAEKAMLERVQYNELGVVHYGYAKPLPPMMHFATRESPSRIATYQQLPAAPAQGRPLTQIYCQLTPEAADEAREKGLTENLDVLLREALQKCLPDFDANVVSVVNQWIPRKLPIFSLGYGRALQDFWQWQEAPERAAPGANRTVGMGSKGDAASGDAQSGSSSIADTGALSERPLVYCGDWTAQALLTGACASGERAAKIIMDRVSRIGQSQRLPARAA